MATRSVIARLDNNGIKAIYCHNDGYLSNNGKILDQHYQNEVKVDNLIAQGDCSSLKDTIADTIFYMRDRGEYLKNRKPIILEDDIALVEFANNACDAQYIYMYVFGAWYVYDNSNEIGNCSYQFIELEDALYVDII